MEKKPRLLIWDADGGIFRASWPHKDMQTKLGIMSAKKKLDAEMEQILQRLNPDYFICFHGKPKSRCFRYDVATINPYKNSRNNRKDTWSEYFKEPLKNHLRDKWNSIELTDLEADDGCSIALNQFKDDYNVVVVYEDHDFNQLADMIGKTVYGYNPNKKITTTLTVEDSRYQWWLQMITGCSGDSVPGIQGIGEEKAKPILELRENDSEEEYFKVVRDAYIKKYGEVYLTFLLENYILLRMMDKPKFDYPANITLQKYHKEVEKHTKLIDL
jgi:5'-3' exonuclease